MNKMENTMFEVVVYDCSSENPFVVDKAEFFNEECAWSWYYYCLKNPLYRKGKVVDNKKVEFKYNHNIVELCDEI